MDYSFLYSPTKGFWSAKNGWNKDASSADLANPKALMQLNFKNTPDLIRSCTDICQHLTTKQTVDFILRLYRAKSERCLERFNGIEQIFPDINIIRRYEWDDWVQDTTQAFSLTHENLIILLRLINNTSRFYAEVGLMKGFFLLVPKYKVVPYEKAPLLAPYSLSSIKDRWMNKKKRSKSAGYKHKL
jgi:hypothetical protein